MRPIKIAPSILSADFGRLAEEVRAVTAAGADYVHVDVMDGHFVPNLTIGPMVVAAIRKATTLPLDVHLMIERPGDYIEAFAKAGADLIGVHEEACPHLHRVLQQIKHAGKRAVGDAQPAHAVAARAPRARGRRRRCSSCRSTPASAARRSSPTCCPKIRELRDEIARRGLDVDIEVDGGIKVDNVATVVEAGANVLVAGSAVFETKDYAATIAALRKNASAAQR